MFTRFFEALRRRWLLRQSMGPILRRMDDHLLDDIGLTRHQANEIMRGHGPDQPEKPFIRPATTQCLSF